MRVRGLRWAWAPLGDGGREEEVDAGETNGAMDDAQIGI